MNSEKKLSELKNQPDRLFDEALNETLNAAQTHKRRINVYTCASGHDTVTIDMDHGTTPMFLGCKTCGKQATSHMYRCSQDLIPEWEWYAPNPTDCAEYELDHVLSGGLLLREYSGSGGTSAPISSVLSQETMKAMYKFQRDFKQKNPGFTQRQFKRAFLKKFPNSLK